MENKPAHESDSTAKARSSIRRRPAIRHSPTARSNRLSADARTMRALHQQMVALDRDYERLTRVAGFQDQSPVSPRNIQRVSSRDLELPDAPPPPPPARQLPSPPGSFEDTMRSYTVNLPDTQIGNTLGAADRFLGEDRIPPTPPEVRSIDVDDTDMPPLRRVSARSRSFNTLYAPDLSLLRPASENRNSSFNPGDDSDPNAWRNLQGTIRPDVHLPSAFSSFTASASSALSSFTSDAPRPVPTDPASNRDAWICEDSEDSDMEETEAREGENSVPGRRRVRSSPRRPRGGVTLRYGRRGLPLSPPSESETPQNTSTVPPPPTARNTLPSTRFPSPGPLDPSHPEHNSFAARHRRLQEREAAIRHVHASSDIVNLSREQAERVSSINDSAERAITDARAMMADVRATRQRIDIAVADATRDNRRAVLADQAMFRPPPPITPPQDNDDDDNNNNNVVLVNDLPLIAWENLIRHHLTTITHNLANGTFQFREIHEMREDVRLMPGLPRPSLPSPDSPQQTVTPSAAELRAGRLRRQTLLSEVDRVVSDAVDRAAVMHRVREVVSQARGTLRRHNDGNDNDNDHDNGTSHPSPSLQPLHPSSWSEQRSRLRSIFHSITTSQQRRRAQQQRLAGWPEGDIETEPDSDSEPEEHDGPSSHHHHHHNPPEEAGRQEIERFLRRPVNEPRPDNEEAHRMQSIWEGSWTRDFEEDDNNSQGSNQGTTTTTHDDAGREEQPTIEERIRAGEPIITEEDILADIAELDRRDAAREEGSGGA